MTKPKYKLTINQLETRHNVHKLERDGFSRERIIADMYKLTQGATTEERRKIVSQLYDRVE